MVQYLLAVVLAVSFSKGEFFSMIDSKDKETIIALEKKIKEQPQSSDRKAYLGTTMMKAADFEKLAGDKLNKFKAGKALLEEAINSNSTNVEYRFLRLIIQEHAPKLLKYNTNLSADAEYIKSNIDKAPNDVKAAIKRYAAVSANLKL